MNSTVMILDERSTDQKITNVRDRFVEFSLQLSIIFQRTARYRL